MFLLKKIISPFFMPVPACLFLALMGLFCLWFTGKDSGRESGVRKGRTVVPSETPTGTPGELFHGAGRGQRSEGKREKRN